MPKKPPETPTWRGHYAGFASRLVAVVIDLLVVAITMTMASLLYNIVFVNLAAFYQTIFGKLIQITNEAKIIIVISLIFFTFAFYFIFFWTVIGSTIGGVILGLKIVNQRGKNPTFWQSTIRFLVEFFIPLIGMIGSIWILFNQRRQALFDQLAGTFVIYAWDAKPDEKFLKKTTNQITGGEIEEESR
jgi:uncharacterized RDD family membrane protein YckC